MEEAGLAEEGDATAEFVEAVGLRWAEVEGFS